MLIYHYLHSVILHHATRILNDALGIPNYPSRISSMHLGAQNMHLQHAHGIPHFALEIPHYALGIPQYASEILNHIPPSLHKIMIYFNLQMFFDAHLACKSCDFPTIYLQIFPTLHTHLACNPHDFPMGFDIQSGHCMPPIELGKLALSEAPGACDSSGTADPLCNICICRHYCYSRPNGETGATWDIRRPCII